MAQGLKPALVSGGIASSAAVTMARYGSRQSLPGPQITGVVRVGQGVEESHGSGKKHKKAPSANYTREPSIAGFGFTVTSPMMHGTKDVAIALP